MNKVEINFMNMTDTVISGCEEKKELWESIAPINLAISSIKGYRIEVAALSFEQASATTVGATENLIDEFNQLAQMVYDIIQRLRPYALASKNKELHAKVDYSLSELQQGKQIDTINLSKIVFNEASKHLAAMADYDLSQERLDTLESAINGVAMLSGNRDAIIGKRKTATEQIPELIKRIRLQLTMLDDLFPALVGDKAFVDTYENNRRIIDRA